MVLAMGRIWQSFMLGCKRDIKNMSISWNNIVELLGCTWKYRTDQEDESLKIDDQDGYYIPNSLKVISWGYKFSTITFDTIVSFLLHF